MPSIESSDALTAQQSDLLLREILQPNVDCAYGQAHDFSAIGTVDDYRTAVPLVGYEDLRPWIDRMAEGENQMLTKAPAIAFFKTSGSTSKPKLIPVTRAFAAQKSRAFAAYWQAVYAKYPAVKTGRMIANFGDVVQTERTAGGTKMMSETSFWNERMQIARGRSKWPTPPALRRIEDPELRFFVAARYALQGPLDGIMCLNPSTLLSFCRAIKDNREALADGLDKGTLGRDAPGIDDEIMRDIQEGLEQVTPPPVLLDGSRGQGPLRLAELWPDLRLTICWQSEAVRPYGRLVAPYLEGIALRDYLTQSSECIMTIPITDNVSGGRLAHEAHFYEFIRDEDAASDSPATLLAEEIEPGQIYELVASTAGGFYRYRTGDRLKVTDHLDGVPLLDFVGRAGIGSSMTGEKLTEQQVRQAYQEANLLTSMQPAQFLCFPRASGQPHYGLLLSGLEGAAESKGAVQIWIDAFERALQVANCEYQDKRLSGRLGPPRGLVAGPDAFDLHRQQIAKQRRVSPEQIKTGLLTSALDLDRHLPAEMLTDADR